MTTAEKYPVDFEAVERGHIIDAAAVARIVGHAPSNAELVNLSKAIEKGLWENGKPFTVVIRRREIHILDDERATKHNRKRFGKHRRGLYRSHQRLCAVDATKLEGDERRFHERAILAQAATVAAVSQTSRVPTPIAYQRQTPGIPGPAPETP